MMIHCRSRKNHIFFVPLYLLLENICTDIIEDYYDDWMKPVLQVVAKFNECRTRSIFNLYTYFLLKESIKVPLLNDIGVSDQENGDIEYDLDVGK